MATAFPYKGHINPDVVVFSGRVLPDTTAAPTVVAGRGVTCAMAVAGIYVLTLPIAFQAFVTVQATLSLASAADVYVQVLTKVASARTVTIAVYSGGGTTPLDVADAADNELNFYIEVQTTPTPCGA